MHIGALASAASTLPAKQRNVVWSIGAGLVLTRIVLLAHWASDVVAGLVIGAVTERILRLVTGYDRDSGLPTRSLRQPKCEAHDPPKCEQAIRLCAGGWRRNIPRHYTLPSRADERDGRTCSEDIMRKQENSQIAETAKEARGAELGPTVRNMLVWSLGLVVAAFTVTYFMFFRT